MTVEQFLNENNVDFVMSKRRYSYSPGDTVEGLENVLGKTVWLCDYHNGKNLLSNPLRNIPPTEAIVCPMTEATFNNVIGFCPSPIFFKKIKDGKVTDEEICPFDNTEKANSIHIFETEILCKAAFTAILFSARKEVEDYMKKGEKKLSRIDKLIRENSR